ncbi:putative mitochondrial large ribosomal subunit protein [Phaeomoniella chlamydospora]|uniref:Putative mitochondrial large ribosomal subunit protein n=1 Tax=Phaeomoniella chlamydospora TaxID=158046 RepID=A0A0G2GFX8_PHACM|nr:putative mitochondrial large ribosomal subunit protein [Phaeomoniella chlamydospora]
MASISPMLGLFGRALELRPSISRAGPLMQPKVASSVHVRGAKNLTATQVKKEATKKKRKKFPNYKLQNLKDARQYTLCDAMQYIRAFEVGRPPTSAKYEVHIRLKTKRDGPVIKNQIKLPHSVKTDLKICAICPPDSNAARDARLAGATLVGEEDIFDVLKSGKVDFDRVIAHPDSMQKIGKAGLPRILGPKGLMPNAKAGTVVENMRGTIGSMMGGSFYRERVGMLRLAVGQLGFNPEQLRDNIRAFIQAIKKDANSMSDQMQKDIHEVVLSSTNAPGFTLSGEFRSEDSVSTKALSTL